VAIANAPAASGRPPSAGPARDNRPLVLVVDDEESYRQALASGLTREGFAVESAGDGHEPVPIIMVTARDSEVDIVLGLELGASDYVAKPFRLRELVARMRAVLRRGVAVAEHHEEVLSVGPVRLDAGRREVTVAEVPVELSRKEFDLLALLMAHSGQVVTRDWCIDRLWWDQELTDTRTLDTHIKRLRRKVEPDPANPRHLVTVRGVGFRFEA
jgi:two-component system response regulator RegX3